MAREDETLLPGATVAINERQRKWVMGKLLRDLHALKGKRVVLLGLFFTPNTDDLREATSLWVACSLDALGALVVSYNPVVGKKAAKRLFSPKKTSGPLPQHNPR